MKLILKLTILSSLCIANDFAVAQPNKIVQIANNNRIEQQSSSPITLSNHNTIDFADVRQFNHLLNKQFEIMANTSQVEKNYEVIVVESYGFGVGGMVIMTFSPYLLFQDGTIYKIAKTGIAPEDLEIENSQRTSPSDWGKWIKNGDRLQVQWGDGKSNDWDNYFSVVPGSSNERLHGYYTSIGGGGNTALGGDVMIAVSNNLTFFEDGSFSQQKSSGGSAPGVTTSSTSQIDGTYEINGYTITFKNTSGQLEKNFSIIFPKK